MSEPVLAIVIVSWNVRALLRDCLASIPAGTALPTEAYRIIVVDNGSHDGSADRVARDFPHVELIRSIDNLGFADGCQRGYDATDADIVMLLNPDTVVDPGAIDSMLATIAADPAIGILGSRLRNSDGSFQRAAGGAFPTLRNMAWNYLFLDRLCPKRWAPAPVYIVDDTPDVRPIDWVSGASLTFRRAAVGPRIFHPAFFMFGEDMELCDRVARAGWRVMFSGRQTITHHHGQSFARQSSVEVLATVYKGPRFFFRRTHGRLAGAAYDLILFTGYLVRWIAFGVLARLRPGAGHDQMARFSRRYLGTMLRAIVPLPSPSARRE